MSWSAGRQWLARAALALALAPAASVPVSANVTLINAPQAWARGAAGQGVVVAVLDSGVDLTQPELAARWRGGPHAWFDPYGQHPDSPVDLTGHGTQVLGVILSVAPEARWIAARLFDDRGHATTAAIHAALRWVLDPDGDPATADAPQVINNSWSSAKALCDPEFEPDLRALRAAGILPVFAAGTGAPASPATLPEAFAVGALTDALTLAADSPRGPAPCAADPARFPALVAPGVDIPVIDRAGAGQTASGTSLAAAHVSGALALLLSVQPGLSADAQAAALQASAVDLGVPGPDPEFGYGRLDAGAAVEGAQPAGPPAVGLWLAGGLAVGVGVGILGASWLRRRHHQKGRGHAKS